MRPWLSSNTTTPIASSWHRSSRCGSALTGTYPAAVGAEARPPHFDRIEMLLETANTNPTVAALAAQQGKDPVELMIDLAVQTDLAQLFVQKSTPLSDDLLATLVHPDTVMTFSDAGAHVSQIVDCSIQTFLLAYWERERGLLPIETAIRMMTMAPAWRWGLHRRGAVRAGYVADLNVLDPARIAPELPTVEHDLPTGAPRLVQRARGITATLVAVEPIVRDGEHTGASPAAWSAGSLIDARAARSTRGSLAPAATRSRNRGADDRRRVPTSARSGWSRAVGDPARRRRAQEFQTANSANQGNP